MRFSALSILCMLAALFGCESSQPLSAPPEASPDPVETSSGQVPESQVVGFLVTRGHRIELRHGSDGPSFTVKLKDGSVVSSNLSLADFAAQFPALHEVFNSGHAKSGSTWAGLDGSSESSR